MGADGQVTVGELVMKASARKVRRLYHDQVLVGFSGATADAFALFERFERQLEHYHGNTRRAAVELAREWRGDRFLRELEAWLLIAGKDGILVLSGTGDVVETAAAMCIYTNDQISVETLPFLEPANVQPDHRDGETT